MGRTDKLNRNWIYLLSLASLLGLILFVTDRRKEPASSQFDAPIGAQGQSHLDTDELTSKFSPPISTLSSRAVRSASETASGRINVQVSHASLGVGDFLITWLPEVSASRVAAFVTAGSSTAAAFIENNESESSVALIEKDGKAYGPFILEDRADAAQIDLVNTTVLNVKDEYGGRALPCAVLLMIDTGDAEIGVVYDPNRWPSLNVPSTIANLWVGTSPGYNLKSVGHGVHSARMLPEDFIPPCWHVEPCKLSSFDLIDVTIEESLVRLMLVNSVTGDLITRPLVVELSLLLMDASARRDATPIGSFPIKDGILYLPRVSAPPGNPIPNWYPRLDVAGFQTYTFASSLNELPGTQQIELDPITRRRIRVVDQSGSPVKCFVAIKEMALSRERLRWSGSTDANGVTGEIDWDGGTLLVQREGEEVGGFGLLLFETIAEVTSSALLDHALVEVQIPVRSGSLLVQNVPSLGLELVAVGEFGGHSRSRASADGTILFEGLLAGPYRLETPKMFDSVEADFVRRIPTGNSIAVDPQKASPAIAQWEAAWSASESIHGSIQLDTNCQVLEVMAVPVYHRKGCMLNLNRIPEQIGQDGEYTIKRGEPVPHCILACVRVSPLSNLPSVRTQARIQIVGVTEPGESVLLTVNEIELIRGHTRGDEVPVVIKREFAACPELTSRGITFVDGPSTTYTFELPSKQSVWIFESDGGPLDLVVVAGSRKLPLGRRVTLGDHDAITFDF